MSDSTKLANTSFRNLAAFGKRIEYYIIGLMLKEGLDVYVPLVDDHAVDAIVKRADGSTALLQIKARSDRVVEGGLQTRSGFSSIQQTDSNIRGRGMVKIGKVALSSLLIFCTASSVFAFDVDGIRTGITTADLVAIRQRRGLEVKETVVGNWTMGKFAEYRIDGMFTFCGGGLISFSRSIDFDVDYVPFLNQTTGKYGAPQVRTKALEVSGAPGQTVPSVEMIWYTGNDRITLSFSPEMRDGKGGLRFNRGASVDYLTKSSCRPAASW